jgi:hypothetical protein
MWCTTPSPRHTCESCDSGCSDGVLPGEERPGSAGSSGLGVVDTLLGAGGEGVLVLACRVGEVSIVRDVL